MMHVPSPDQVRAEIGRLGPLEAYRSLIAQNDELIRGSDLGNGREIAAARTAIHTGLVAHWAEEQHEKSAYLRPFAVVSLGGTGREEMTPFSDTDFAFLFDDEIDDNPFVLELNDQLRKGAFCRSCGFDSEIRSFNLDDMPKQREMDLNAFLDMKPVYDPGGLHERFRTRIRESYDPFEHFLYVSRN